MTRTERLIDALEPPRGGTTAFVGGGGKTSAILLLAEELAAAGRPVVVTTTTRVGSSMADALPLVLAPEGGDLAPARMALERALRERGCAFVSGGADEEGKFRSAGMRTLDELTEGLVVDAILVEADGSRQRPLKAPAAHEPVIPPRARLVVPVAGLDSLGRTLGPDVAHRPERVAAVCGVAAGADVEVTPELLASLLSSPQGGLRSVPRSAQVRPILNKVRMVSEELAVRAAGLLLERADERMDRVIVSDVLSGWFGYVASGSASP
ncbi:MAG: selenium cofactor biosynthesis protein YqeC [Candidatus Eisenbacteria bacterium]